MPAVSTQLNSFIMPAASAGARSRGPGFWSRLLDAIHQSRMRQAEREIALMIERGGGRLTDDLERKIERRFV